MLRNYPNKYKERHEVALNKLHPDGRIYYKLYPKTSMTCSPFHKLFHTQIEEGIKPIVNLLIKKGYFTLGSCEGHISEGGHAYVSFIVENINNINDVKDKISKIKQITTYNTHDHSRYREGLFNVKWDEISEEAESFKRNEMTESCFNSDGSTNKITTESLNKLFMKKNKKYWVMEIRINENNHPISIIDRLFLKNKISKYRLLKALKNIRNNYD